MVCEMYDYLPEAIHLCAILEQLYLRFCYNKTKAFKESDATQNDLLAVLLHVIDRVPAKEGEESLQELLRVAPSEGKNINEDVLAMWLETEETLMDQRDKINGLDIDEAEKAKMHLVIPPAAAAGNIGPPLDKGVYEMIITKQKGFREDQDLDRRNDLKSRIFKLGHICQVDYEPERNKGVEGDRWILSLCYWSLQESRALVGVFPVVYCGPSSKCSVTATANLDKY